MTTAQNITTVGLNFMQQVVNQPDFNDLVQAYVNLATTAVIIPFVSVFVSL